MQIQTCFQDKLLIFKQLLRLLQFGFSTYTIESIRRHIGTPTKGGMGLFNRIELNTSGPRKKPRDFRVDKHNKYA